MDAFEIGLQGLLPRSQWSRRGFVMTSLAAGFALSVHPVSAQTITTDASGLDAGEVKIPVADGSVPAYRAMPAEGGPFPTVLVVQEVFGVHEHIKDLCRRLAKAGYYAIAPELYARQGDPSKISDTQETDQDDRRPRCRTRRSCRISTRLSAMRSRPARPIQRGSRSPAFAGAGGSYGFTRRIIPRSRPRPPGTGAIDRPRTELQPKYPIDLAADLKAPVLGLYGAADQGIPVESVERMQDACKKAGKTCEIKVYPDTPHGFNADYRPSYRADAAKDGWAKMLAWFKDHGAG